MTGRRTTLVEDEVRIFKLLDNIESAPETSSVHKIVRRRRRRTNIAAGVAAAAISAVAFYTFEYDRSTEFEVQTADRALPATEQEEKIMPPTDEPGEGATVEETFSEFIGQDVATATDLAERTGLDTRVAILDGVRQRLTDDLREGRVNFVLEGEIVSGVLTDYGLASLAGNAAWLSGTEEVNTIIVLRSAEPATTVSLALSSSTEVTLAVWNEGEWRVLDAAVHVIPQDERSVVSFPASLNPGLFRVCVEGEGCNLVEVFR